jgi:hypothetical protein
MLAKPLTSSNDSASFAEPGGPEFQRLKREQLASKDAQARETVRANEAAKVTAVAGTTGLLKQVHTLMKSRQENTHIDCATPAAIKAKYSEDAKRAIAEIKRGEK